MNKYQKELIKNCEQYEPGTPFDNLYIIPSGKLYNGFWGKTGYNKIYLVCGVNEKFYLIGKEYQVDVLDFEIFSNISCEIPPKLNCVRLFHRNENKRFVIKQILSTIRIGEQ